MRGLELLKFENCATVACIKIDRSNSAKAAKHTEMKKITILFQTQKKQNT